MSARTIVMEAVLNGARTAQDVLHITKLPHGTVKSCLSDLVEKAIARRTELEVAWAGR